MKSNAGLWVVLFCTAALSLQADVVEMRNGDRYVGKVMSLDGQTLVVVSDVLGTVRLARQQVRAVKFGDAGTNESGSGAEWMPGAATNRAGAGATNRLAPVAIVSSNGVASVSPSGPPLGLSSNLVAQVQKQFLSNADPAAKEKFNELLGGLLSGQMSVEDVRAQAKTMAEQIRSLRKDLDEESGWMVDFYLGILDRFVKDAEGGTK